MAKKPISVTLDELNLVWLRGVSARSGARSLSETLDRLITSAREGRAGAAIAPRSVVGTIDISPVDPMLDTADEAVRDLFARSLSRPIAVKESRAPVGAKRKRRV